MTDPPARRPGDPAEDPAGGPAAHQQPSPPPSTQAHRPGPPGAAAAPWEERKLVTVVAAGVAAGGAAAGGDPEDTHAQTAAVMRHLTERIGHYGGVVHSQAMGRLLGVFGADRSHDDDPERAVRAALDMLDGHDQPPGAARVCAGVATGEVIVTHPDQADAGGVVTVAGDVLTAAIGLQASAAPGTVLVGAGTYRATSRVIDYRPLQQASDQLTTWLTAWQAQAPRGRTGAEIDARQVSPLTERERELKLLTDLLERFLREREPQLLTVISEPGLGKTRLAGELGRLADQASVLVGWRLGRAQPHAAGTVAALAEIVKAHADILDTDTADVAQRKLQDVVGDAVTDPDEAAWVTRQVRALLGPDPLRPAQGDRRREMLAGWFRFFQAAASSRPLVVVFEDLQWADGMLLEFVEDLAEQVSTVPLLVVATARPELLDLRPGWGGGKRNAATVSLSPLSRAGTETLLDALLGDQQLPAGARELLLAGSGGNPLYVEEYVRMLHDLPTRAPAPRPGGSLPIPESIKQLIAARLDTLPPGDRLLLQDAAVIGQTFWAGALAAVSSCDREQVAEGMRRLERREFLRRARVASVAGETEYAFRHALIRDAAYNQILRGDRATKHRRVAAWIQGLNVPYERAEVLAYHYSRALALTRAAGQPTGELADQTRHALRVAGDRVGSLGAMTSAAGLYEQALALWPRDAPDRAGLLLRLGEALTFGQHTGADTLLQARELFESGGNLEQTAEVDVILAQLARIHGDHATAATHLERALALGPADSPELLVAMSAHAIELLLTDAYPKAIQVGQHATRLGAEHGLVSVEGLGHHAVGTARLLLGDPDGVREMHGSVALLVEAGHAAVDFARFTLPMALWWFGDLRQCARSLAEQRAAVHDTELVMSWFDIVQAALDYAAGRWDAASELVDRYLGSRGAQPGNHEPWCLAVRGWIRLGRGDLPGALDDAGTAAALAGRTRSRRYLQVAGALRGQALFALGRPADAEAGVRTLLAEQHAHPDESHATPGLAALLIDLDLPPEQLSTQLPPRPWDQACRALADRDFARALDRFAAVGSLVDQAAVRLRLARQHRAGGDLDRAATHLDAAVSVYQAAGARAYLRQAEILAEEIGRTR